MAASEIVHAELYIMFAKSLQNQETIVLVSCQQDSWMAWIKSWWGDYIILQIC